MTHPKATPDEPPQGWRVFRSSTDRLWATREKAYDIADDKNTAWRTVDADDWTSLCRCIAEQESRASLASAS